MFRAPSASLFLQGSINESKLVVCAVRIPEPYLKHLVLKSPDKYRMHNIRGSKLSQTYVNFTYNSGSLYRAGTEAVPRNPLYIEALPY